MDGGSSLPTNRLYPAAIALASGGYSVASGTAGSRLGSTVMVVLGLVVVVHGVVLLTDWAERLDTASGPLMLGYAVVMVANQAWFTMGSAGMGGSMMGSGMGSMGVGWDPGMVVLALLMAVSGVVMTIRDEM